MTSKSLLAGAAADERWRGKKILNDRRRLVSAARPHEFCDRGHDEDSQNLIRCGGPLDEFLYLDGRPGFAGPAARCCELSARN